MKTLFVFLLIIQTSFLVANERAFSVTEIGSSAKYIGLGGIELSTDSAASVFHNPALIYGNYSYSISMFTTQLFDEVNYRNFAISKQINNFFLGFGYMDARVSDIPKTIKITTDSESYFDINGYYNLNYSLYKIGLSYQLSKKIIAGLGLSYVDNSISDVNANGLNLDVGFNYKINTHSLALSVDNILQHYDLQYSNDGTESYPFKTTLSYRKNWNFMSSLIQYSVIKDHLPQSAIGVELKHPTFTFLDAFLGYRSDYYLNDLDYKLTLGLGLNFFGVSFHYAYQKSDYFQEDNYSFFSMTIRI